MTDGSTSKSSSPCPPVQQILLDEQGVIIESAGEIFSAACRQGCSALECSSFVESIFDVLLLLLQPGHPGVYFAKVETIDDYTSGVFDCSFLRVEWGENDPAILWTIYERSEEYLRLGVCQQQNNEARM